MFGRPMPEPKPMARCSSVAVVYPSCMACSTSGMPLPSSSMTTSTELGVTDRFTWARFACMITFISPS